MPSSAPRAFAPRQISPPKKAGANWAMAAKEMRPMAASRVLCVVLAVIKKRGEKDDEDCGAADVENA